MGRRSNFPRIPQDAYSTPAEAVAPLLPHLEPGSRFFEPCAGEGRLIEHLVNAGHICVGRCDLPIDARTWRYLSIESGVLFITNPPGAGRRCTTSSSISPTSRRLGCWSTPVGSTRGSRFLICRACRELSASAE